VVVVYIVVFKAISDHRSRVEVAAGEGDDDLAAAVKAVGAEAVGRTEIDRQEYRAGGPVEGGQDALAHVNGIHFAGFQSAGEGHHLVGKEFGVVIHLLGDPVLVRNEGLRLVILRFFLFLAPVE
jgi:hypothetical protein